jgi:hypothetical protein
MNYGRAPEPYLLGTRVILQPRQDSMQDRTASGATPDVDVNK